MKFFSLFIPFSQALHIHSPSSSLTRISSITDAFNTLVKSKNEKIMFHGCHCVSFIVPQGGIPVDERDQACMSWKASRSCVALKNGPCNGEYNPTYDWNGESCDDLDGCQKSLCEIDQYYSNKIQDFDTELVFISSDEIGDQCKYGYVRPKFVDVYNRQTAFENKDHQYFPKPEVRMKGVEKVVSEVVQEIDPSIIGSRSLSVGEQQVDDSVPEVHEESNPLLSFEEEGETETAHENIVTDNDIFQDWRESEKKFRKFQQHQNFLRNGELYSAFQEPSFENVSKHTLRDSCCNIEGHIWRKYNSETEMCKDGSVSPLVSYVA